MGDHGGFQEGDDGEEKGGPKTYLGGKMHRT